MVQHRLQVLQDPSVTLSCWHLENSLLCHSSRKIKKRSAAQWLSIMNRCLWDSEPPLVGERGGYLKSLEITSFHLVLVCNYLQTIYHPCGWERERIHLGWKWGNVRNLKEREKKKNIPQRALFTLGIFSSQEYVGTTNHKLLCLYSSHYIDFPSVALSRTF